MSVHNGEKTIRAAIRSILWQTCTDWELVLVNDASTDSTARILRQFHDSRIRVMDEPQQKGLAVRLNHCVALARGRYVARMDADDIAYPERFERQVEYLKAHPDIDLLGHGAVLFTERDRYSESILLPALMKKFAVVPGGDSLWRIRHGWGSNHGLRSIDMTMG